MKKTERVVLFKTLSERLDKNGNPYVDYYLVSKVGDVLRQVRVQKVFRCDTSWLDKMAVSVPSTEEILKYF